MAKDPAFLFYTGDFSTGTQFFSDEQVGKYIRLLMAQHQHGHLDEKHMLQICKTYDKDVFSKFSTDSGGRYFNERLEDEIIKRQNYSKSRANNRTSKKNISVTYLPHMENENIVLVLLESNWNGESQEEKQKMTMVVIGMMKIWMENKPGYSAMQEVDYPALLTIAYQIAKEKGWKKSQIVASREADVLDSWQKMCRFLMSTEAGKFLPTLTIDGLSIPKNFQKLVEAMKAGHQAKLERNLESEKTRITPEKYFTE